MTTAVATRAPRARRGLRAALGLGALVAGLVLGRLFLIEPVHVSSDSMVPTLSRGDTVLVEKLTPGVLAPQRGDLLAFCDPGDPLSDAMVLKRVVGLPGDTVEVRDAILHVNGRPVDEPYVDHERIDGLYFGPVTVPAGQVFLFGDNRANSIDSRTFGGVPLDEVVGRAVLKVWPMG